MKQTFVLVLISSALSCAFALPKCQNHTLPDGTSCQSEGHFSHTYADPDHCSKYWIGECYNGCVTNLSEHYCQLDYLFDTTHGYCNYPKNVHCGDRNCDGRDCNQ